ncbi:tryptophan synthase subunit alpha [Archaeoglobus sp.]
MIQKPSLITYITAGDPNFDATLQFLEILSRYSEVIELGIPFSDPMADGRTIEKSHYRALKAGIGVRDVFKIVEKFKDNHNTPVVLMTYYNPIFAKGLDNFIGTAKDSGVDAILVVDLPVEEANDYLSVCEKYDVKTVFLASPNTPNDRLKAIDEASSGFVYLVSLYGTTGARERISNITFDLIRRARSVCSKPLAVGFGVSKAEHVRELLNAGADGVVVGSAIVKLIEEFGEKACDKIEEKCRELRKGLNI